MRLIGGGKCAELVRSFDWGESPLGYPNDWPVELQTLVAVMLGSLQPMLIVWGPKQITLYNDGYAAMCGNRHPQAFGRPFGQLWHDIWDQVEPIISAAYAGEGTSMDDIAFTMHRKGYPEETHFSFSYTPVRDPWGTVLGMFCACNETTAEVIARRDREEQHDRLLRILEVSPGGIATLRGPDHVFEFANEEYYALIGMGREIVGKTVAESLSEVVRQGFIEILDGVYSSGEPFVARGVPIELNRGPLGEPQERIIDFTYQPMSDRSGQVSGILVQALDVTERMDEAKRVELVANELGHRLKNQLAMVQAIASQTLRNAKDLRTARRVLSERIGVLSAAHDTVVQGGPGSSRVRRLVNQMLAVHDDAARPRFEVSGTNVRIGSRPSLSMSLILHELATNAFKYGALSVPDGRVELKWDVVGLHKDRFELTWIESGGPPVEVPSIEGSGSRLIKAGLAGAADNRVEIYYEPAGLRCVVSADLSSFQQEH
ncbi:hypothetical protein E2F50_20000 [Rhizobium deserti]|uniref:histidine kinase n=1 Tax=Rhizobium deserti TaxID=2547961 RepID=A0A4R5UA10_9HYPH|nr:HWE histidine kinase domain-containing protein [Rhizobium deserti]TDK31236.1 hypothetical protein E2F50_20000 [Rhizobium deserti]